MRLTSFDLTRLLVLAALDFEQFANQTTYENVNVFSEVIYLGFTDEDLIAKYFV